MIKVGVHEAKTRLSELLRRVAGGEEVLIMKGREPVAKLSPVLRRRERPLGSERGKFVVPKSFDAPLPEALLKEFER